MLRAGRKLCRIGNQQKRWQKKLFALQPCAKSNIRSNT
jgi:hypothetical protein